MTESKTSNDTVTASESANLPIIRHQIALYEENGQIVLDITDETGGLGLKLFLSTVAAHNLGTRMVERVRAQAAKASDDPIRLATESFASDETWKGAQNVGR